MILFVGTKVKKAGQKMCANEMLMPIEEIDENIVEKYNDELQQERIESSMIDIIENLEKLYFID